MSAEIINLADRRRAPRRESSFNPYGLLLQLSLVVGALFWIYAGLLVVDTFYGGVPAHLTR